MSASPATLAVYKDFLRSGRGADRAVAAFANAMAARGHAVHVITQQRPEEPLSVTFGAAVTCHHVPMSRIRSAAGFLNKLLLRTAMGARLLRALPWVDLMRETSRRLQACLRELRPDIVVSAGANECVELTYAGPLGAPLVQMFHVYPPTCFAKNKYQRVARLRAALPQVAECQVLLPSHRATLRPYTQAPVAVIGNAIDWPPDEPLPECAARAKVIVYVAYFTKDKNQLALLEAFAHLRAEGWQLHLYGTGTPAWEQRLRARAAALGIAERVRFFGVTRTPRVVLRQASICAFPSLTEGFGLALAEAMWCGLPCVGFQGAPGVSELIAHEANGLLAEGSSEAFAAQLQRLVDDPGLRERLGTTAAKTIRATYAAQRVWQQWDDLLWRHIPHLRGSEAPEGAKTASNA